MYCELLQQVSYCEKANSLIANGLLKAAKIVFTECGLLKKIFSDTGTNFTSDKFIQFCRQMKIQHAITSLYHHQSNDHVEVCIKFVKCTVKN